MVFCSGEFSQHESVIFVTDRSVSLQAIIAIHSTRLGPALGGCRAWAYTSESQALEDVLRLSRAMTLKASIAGVALGGGKSVVLLEAGQRKTPELMRAMGHAIDELGGRYIAGEDIGTNVADMAEMRRVTAYVAGAPPALGGSGEPAGSTALGCFEGIRACAKFLRGSDDLAGLRAAVQGIGKVGWKICERLRGAGVELLVADVNEALVRRAQVELGARAATPEEILEADADVLVPCAFGGVLNDYSIPRLKVAMVAGAANNQLDSARHGDQLAERGILYAPDYVINGGGLIQLAIELRGYDAAEVERRVRAIASTLTDVFRHARARCVSTNRAADELAQARLATAA